MKSLVTRLAFLALSFSNVIVLASVAEAVPAQVLIIRHGEKINDNDPDLSARGKARASGLVGFFTHNTDVLRFGSIVAIYATDPKADGSERAIQTVTPTAKTLGLEINKDYSKKMIAGLVKDIMKNPTYEGRTVLISWVHDSIPELAREFGCTSSPDKWHGSVFDRVWVLRFNGDNVVFKDIPQNLLPGDSAQ